MFKFINKYRLQFLIITTLIVLFLLMSQTHTSESKSRFQSVILTLSYPLQVSAKSVASAFNNFWNSYISLADVKKENQPLRMQLLEMEEKMNQHIENSVQFLRLRDQLLFANKKITEKIKITGKIENRIGCMINAIFFRVLSSLINLLRKIHLQYIMNYFMNFILIFILIFCQYSFTTIPAPSNAPISI